MTLKKRACGPTAQDKKKEHLLFHSKKLLDIKKHDFPSVDQIMTSAKISKGTFYLYFKTKEEVYLELLKRGYQEWVKAINKALSRKNCSIQTVISEYAKFCSKNPEVLFLSSLSSSVLERNVSEKAAFEFKKWVQAQVLIAGKLMAEKMGINEADCRRLYIYSYALSVGIWNHCHPPKIIKKIYQREELKGMNMEFESSLKEALTCLWQGMKNLK